MSALIGVLSTAAQSPQNSLSALAIFTMVHTNVARGWSLVLDSGFLATMNDNGNVVSFGSKVDQFPDPKPLINTVFVG